MDERKIPLPEWLPWATTAVLAALVACIGELWIVEKTRLQILRDDSALAAAELKAVNNQLEAERIVNRRVLDSVRSEFGVALLGPPKGAGSTACGAVVWSPFTKQGYLLFSGAPPASSEGVYQLWMTNARREGGVLKDPLGRTTYSISCGVLLPPEGKMPARMPVSVDASAESAPRFTLVYCEKGGAHTLEDALQKGSIVLASPPP